MNGPRIGSLFSGYGGLDMGVQDVIGGEVAWHVEFDDAPSRILAHHWPGIPNYGDITAVDWATVPPVDVLTGGFPCQDVSLAGARKGLMDGTRSGLWSEYAKAISILRPSLVVIENVRGLLSAKTIEDVDDAPDSGSEYGTAGVGEPVGGNRPVLNAFGRVLLDLAELGYDTEWVGLRAADAGAPHGRYRVFILAHPHGVRWGEGGPESAGRLRGLAPVVGGSPASLVADASSGGCDGRSQVEVGFPLERTVPTGAGTHTLADTGRLGSERREGCESGTPAAAVDPAADTSSERLGEHPREPSAEETRSGSGDLAHGVGGRRADTDWGPYAPAIDRWERTTGRLAPAPTNPDGKNGSHRLSAQFVEWMMGLPAGHVTNPAIGLTRNQQLKALGNGVVPQQAALALTHLLQRKETAA